MKTKRLFAFILSAVIILCCVSTASAADEVTVIDEGTYGSNITWKLYNNKEIVFSGNGEMEEVAFADGPWSNVVNGRYGEFTPTVLTFEEGITSILDSCVHPEDYFDEINIPASVTYISPGALADSIKKYNIAEGNTSYKVEDNNVYSYDGKTILKYNVYNTAEHFTIPDTVEHIYSGAFCFLKYLKSLTIPESVKRIDEASFITNNTIQKIIFEGELEKIPDYSFGYCVSLKEFIFPKGLKSIGKQAFYCCLCLEDIVIPEGVEYIGDGAFEGNYSSRKIVVPESCISLGTAAFDGCVLLEEFYVLSDKLSVEDINNSISKYNKLDNYMYPEKCRQYYDIVIRQLYEKTAKLDTDESYTMEMLEAELTEALNSAFGTSYTNINDAIESPEIENYLKCEVGVSPEYLTVFGYPQNAAKDYADSIGVKYACAHKWSEATCGETKVCPCGATKLIVHSDENADSFCDICNENLNPEQEPQDEPQTESFIETIINTIMSFFNRILEFFKNLF